MDASKESNYDKVMAKAIEKKQAAKERKEEREAAGVVNELVIESTPNGLFTVRWALAGNIPAELKGWFTRKERILAIAKRLGKPVAEHN